MHQDVTYTTGGLVAAAVWELPDQWRVGVAQQLRLLPAFSRIFGRHVPRALRAQRSSTQITPRSLITTSRSSASRRTGKGAVSALR